MTRISRRTVLVGAGAGALTVLLASCVPEPEPEPGPDPTKSPTTPPEPVETPDGVPAPAAWMRSAWSTDPYAHGAVSYLPAGTPATQRGTLGAPINDRVFFAGEAVAASDAGTVAGAVSSGTTVAATVIDLAADGERIAVVGAGIAGAVVTRSLVEAGIDVQVFEARERTGGRLHSVVQDDWPIPVQLGAWMVPTGDPLVGVLDQADIPSATLESATGWSDQGALPTLDPAPIQNAIAASAGSDISLSQALIAAGLDPDDPVLSAVLSWLSATTGVDAERASAIDPPRLLPDSLTVATGNLGDLIDTALADLPLNLSSPIARIVSDDRGVSLRIGTGESLSFDRVVVTVPLGVLQEQSIEFEPPLSADRLAAITAIATGSIECIWLRFDEAFWEPQAALWHAIGTDHALKTWIDLSVITGEPVLVGLVGGALAEEFCALSDSDALEEALAALALFAPPPTTPTPTPGTPTPGASTPG